ncbi:MAG TPA: penicillin acylase family protein, partial [Pyrinomonadaceae bacterium]|nr:penicillin acylase family protein [Pyrinomonadaceae bacterium]
WIISAKPKNWLPKEFSSYADLMKAAETDARQSLAKRLGEDEAKWTWGEANKIRFAHPLAVAPLIGGQFAIAPLALNGSGGSVNVGGSVSMRLIASPPNWDATRHGITLGQSGVPGSPHWRDQLDDWYSGNTRVFPFSQPSVKAATKEILQLVPQK